MPEEQKNPTLQTRNSGAAQSTVNQDATDQNLLKINREFEEKSTAQRAKDLNLPYIDVGAFPINPDILHLVLPEDAKRAFAMPFFKSGMKLRVAVFDPHDAAAQEVIKNLESKGFGVQINIASRASILQACNLYASDQYKLKNEVKNVVGDSEIHYEKELENLAKVKDQISALPAEEALNMLHVSAIKAGASDIHYQPEETACAIRFRIDGVLHTVFDLAPGVYARLAAQLKYKAKMKLNIASVPQDGRFRFIVNERKVDVRVSTLPTEFGEAFVCRILDSGKHFARFEELGFSGRSLEILNRTSSLTQGMVLVTGPTSSGKTTSLYVLLNKFNKPDVKIITLEDPIEYHLSGLTQSQVNEKRGYTFAEGLRSILRQDPDIVMVGEIRDLATAEVATQAALTGHVLLSTLHTNSAVDAIARLLTLGLPPFVIAPAISVIVAQRLVRRLCAGCGLERASTDDEKKLLEKMLADIKTADPSVMLAVPSSLKIAKGCEECNFTGYRGQLVISEILVADDEAKVAILNNKAASEIFAIARKKGMLTMSEDAVLKVLAGITTLDEVHRVINT